MSAYPKSEALFDRCRRFVPSGVSTNTRARSPHPLYFERGEGAWVWDLDGNRHLDIVMGNGAVLLGHGHPAISDAVRSAAASGLTCGVESARMAEAAQTLRDAMGWPDMVRFTNTGTEAVQHALHIARHATGRTRIAKVEGSYHGWSDEVFVSVWFDRAAAESNAGIRPVGQFAGQRSDLVEQVAVLPFNETDRARAELDRVGDDLAAILLEPILIDVGYVPATVEYLRMLRAEASRRGIVLIFDELLTGLNVAVGGAVELTGVVPDLALYGKAIANGYPLAAVGGREELMRMTEPGRGPAFVGTFNGHAVSVAAAAAALPILASGDPQAEAARRAERLESAFAAEAARIGIPARMVRGGAHIHWYFCEDPVTDYRSAQRTDPKAYAAFVGALAERRVLTLPNPLSHHAISLGHDEEALAELADAFAAGLASAAAV